jgi:hypothetical protein
MRNLIINFVAFQCCWVALVAGAGQNLRWPGILCLAAFLAWELYVTEQPRRLAALAGVALAFGIVVDGGYAVLDVMRYAMPEGPLAPWWILGLWVAFALTLTSSLGWLRERAVAGALMAGIAAPMSYYTGYKLGAVSFPMPIEATLAVTGLTWMTVIYALILVTRRLVPAPAGAD